MRASSRDAQARAIREATNGSARAALLSTRLTSRSALTAPRRLLLKRYEPSRRISGMFLIKRLYYRKE